MLSLRMPPDTIRRLDNWRDRQRFKPDRTQVIVAAIESFLDSEGEPKPEPEKPASRGKRRED